MSEPTKEELLARIAELEKQAGGRKGGSLEFRVSEKGGVSVYGLGHFPVTLYYEQWVRLLDSAGAIRASVEENKGKLNPTDGQRDATLDQRARLRAGAVYYVGRTEWRTIRNCHYQVRIRNFCLFS